jgi:phage tail sheath protein FI
MAETLISPGVLARENDSSFIRQQPVNVGAAIIGPTVLGPVEIPTVVTSYSDYVNKFGAGFQSGSDNVSFFTSIAAYNYFNNGGTSLLVARVVSASNTWTPATSTNIENNTFATTASFTFDSASIANFIQPTGSFNVNGVIIAVTGSPAPANTTNTIFVASGSTPANTITAIVAAFNVSKSIAPYSASLQYITSSVSASTGIFFNTVSPVGPAGDLYYVTSGSTTSYFTGGSGATAFVLTTLSEGIIMNSSSSIDISGSLASGSADNIRYQILNSDTASGTFSLLIRQGNDNTNNPIVLETWTGLSLDPFAANFISRVLGDQDQNYNPTTNQIEVSGSYFNASRYVRVSAVNTPTPYYFDNTGVAKSQYTSSIPFNSSGSFTGGVGQVAAGANFYETINGTNTQGLVGADYNNMINLLANQDEYKFNILFAPGLYNSGYTSQCTSMINNTQTRGDSLFVLDLVPYNTTISTVTSQANSRNTSYAASYWPWVQMIDPATGKNVWVPASTVMAGVFAFNDTVAEPWFAPAGINRGGLQVIRAEQKLPQTSRDTLYTNKVNPIATFPGTGTVVYGQKTLQTQASALDRVNVRRLLIALKNYISQIANTLVFEQNSTATRNVFLSQVNPYLESVQQKQGLYAFRVIMNETNNTADVIDRNELIGQIYIQPTRTAEFIYLDFNILPTGATFPA